jgi:hypothetical protein
MNADGSVQIGVRRSHDGGTSPAGRQTAGIDALRIDRIVPHDLPGDELAHADTQTDGEIGRRRRPKGTRPRCGSRRSASARILGLPAQGILAPATAFGRDNESYRISRAMCCASPAAAASGPWKSRPSMRSDFMAATQFGRMSRNGCSTVRASNAPEDTKKTDVGRVREVVGIVPSKSRTPTPLLAPWRPPSLGHGNPL